jgi:hypothetical protein
MNEWRMKARGFGGEDRARSTGESRLEGDRFEKATQRAPCESQNSSRTADANANESTRIADRLRMGSPSYVSNLLACVDSKL